LAKPSRSQKKLLEIALKDMNNAFVLWGFRVGAAVLAEDGKMYEGCNVESWISGLGTCAERNAINHAVLHGNRKINEIAIVMDSKSPNEPKPCGACLQYIHDLAKNANIKVVMAKARKNKIPLEAVVTKRLSELLPFPYRPPISKQHQKTRGRNTISH
jgi:cytidine deaminase